MNNFIGIRINNDLKQRIENIRIDLGYNSTSDCIRFLIDKGLNDVERREVNRHLLNQTCQSLFLSRELLKMLYPSATQATTVIDQIKKEAEIWLQGYKNKVEVSSL